MTEVEPPPAPQRLPPWLAAGAPAWTWLGVAIAVAGFGLLAVAWGQIAGEIQVYRQVPYLVSAGLAGLGLILVGVGVVNIAARHADAADRDRQIDQLVSVMEELREVLGDQREGRG
ncbi:MAG TPA: hypothetical protein VGA69_07980 [Nitriliruptorales bacterium]